MAKGKAPIGYDLKKIVLHHVRGIANNMDDIVEIGADAHRAFHGTFGYKNFIDIEVGRDYIVKIKYRISLEQYTKIVA